MKKKTVTKKAITKTKKTIRKTFKCSKEERELLNKIKKSDTLFFVALTNDEDIFSRLKGNKAKLLGLADIFKFKILEDLLS